MNIVYKYTIDMKNFICRDTTKYNSERSGITKCDNINRIDLLKSFSALLRFLDKWSGRESALLVLFCCVWSGVTEDPASGV